MLQVVGNWQLAVITARRSFPRFGYGQILAVIKDDHQC